MESWQIAQWIKDLLPSLPRRTGRPADMPTTPPSKVRYPSRRLTRDTSVTFEQYNHAQQYLMAYWDTCRLIEGDEERRLISQGRQAPIQGNGDVQGTQFLATTSSLPPCAQTIQTGKNGTCRVNRIATGPYHASGRDPLGNTSGESVGKGP